MPLPHPPNAEIVFYNATDALRVGMSPNVPVYISHEAGWRCNGTDRSSCKWDPAMLYWVYPDTSAAPGKGV